MLLLRHLITLITTLCNGARNNTAAVNSKSERASPQQPSQNRSIPQQRIVPTARSGYDNEHFWEVTRDDTWIACLLFLRHLIMPITTLRNDASNNNISVRTDSQRDHQSNNTSDRSRDNREAILFQHNVLTPCQILGSCSTGSKVSVGFTSKK